MSRDNTPPDTLSAIIKSEDYGDYVPAKVPTKIPKGYWSGLGLDIYEFDQDNEGALAPGVFDYVFGILMSGNVKGQIIKGDTKKQNFQMHPGTVSIVPAEHSVYCEWESKDVSQENPVCAALFLDHDLMNKVALESSGFDSGRIELVNHLPFEEKFIHQLAVSLKHEAELGSCFGQMYGQTAAQLLAVYILSKYSVFKPNFPDRKSGLPKWKISQVTDYVNAHLAEDISLDVLASVAGLSSYYFARMFKISMGLAPHQYVVQCRLEKARELLTHTHLSVTQISFAVGYENQSHLSKLFKRKYGLTPLNFRRQALC